VPATIYAHFDQAATIKSLIYHVAGERTAEITAALPGGRNQVLAWDRRQAAPGIYLVVVVKNGQRVQTLKLGVTH
jgi:hypothetical protein